MVGGLVQDEQVDRHGQRLGQGQARLLASRQVTHQPVHGVAPEAERGQVGTGVATVSAHAGHRLELLQYGPPLVQDLGLKLVEVGEVDVGAASDPAIQRGHLSGQQADQGGLAGPVGSDQGHGAAPLHPEGDVAEDDLGLPSVAIVVAGSHALQLGHQARRTSGLGEAEAGCRVVGFLDHDAVQPLQGLHPALDLTGLGGLVPEAFDEALGPGHLPGLLGGGRPLHGQLLLAGHYEVGKAPHVLGDPVPGQF